MLLKQQQPFFLLLVIIFSDWCIYIKLISCVAARHRTAYRRHARSLTQKGRKREIFRCVQRHIKLTRRPRLLAIYNQIMGRLLLSVAATGAAAAAERSTTVEPGYYSFLHTSTNKCSNVWSAHLDLTRRRAATAAAACLTWLPTCKMCNVRLRSRLRKMSSNDSANLEMFSFIIFLFFTESAELLFLPVSSMNLSGGFLNRPCTTVSTQHTTAAAFLIGTYWINVHAFKNCDATRPHRFIVGCAGRTIRDESHNYIDNRMITSQLNRFTVKELKEGRSM